MRISDLLLCADAPNAAHKPPWRLAHLHGNRKINLSTGLAGQFVGIREVADKISLVSFLDFDLGFFDEAAARVEPGANPFASKVLTIPGLTCKGSAGSGPCKGW
jgi:hypothetical protein